MFPPAYAVPLQFELVIDGSGTEVTTDSDQASNADFFSLFRA